jgi:hypothetical protein
MSFPAIFKNANVFHDAFVCGLEEMLEHDGLGVFILVLANASYDASIFKKMQPQLAFRFKELVSALEHRVDDAPDDIQVFEKLMSIGLNELHVREYRQLGPWRVQFNQLRSLRPSRMSDVRVDSLSLPFNSRGFHFNKPFLQKEILWEGRLLGSQSRLLYNKFPFVDHHCILAINPEENRPQLITCEEHQYIWQLGEALMPCLPYVGFGYNAYGAAASVNHQHFQMYMREDSGYPVENDRWRHNGGLDKYPIDCYRQEDCDVAWQCIESLHGSNTAYNLLYRPGLLYILPRRMQGHFEYAKWMTGVGWADVMGEVTAFNREDYEQVSRQQLEEQFVNAAL